MSKFTPGPWHVVEYAGFYDLQQDPFYSDEDNLLDEAKNDNAEYNAKLAAAAPDLLEALISLKNWVGKLDDWKGEDPPFGIVDEAIRKAIV